MELRPLGTTGLEVSAIGFGVWTVSTGWWGTYSDEDAIALLREGKDLGITFFDTADTYGSGRGETLLAAALGGDRAGVVIGTKFGYDWQIDRRGDGQREHPQDFSPAAVRRSLEGSLDRLKTDYIDLYQLHNPRLTALQSDDLFELLERFREEGKIRAYGAALGPAIGWRDEGLYGIEHRRLPMLQIIHNILEQDPGADFIAASRQVGTGFAVRVPLSSGLLEGRYTAETTFAPTDHRSHRKREWLDNGLKKLDALRFLTEEWEGTIGQAALRWLLAEPSIATTLPNIYNSDQLREFVAAADLPPLSTEHLERVDALYRANFGLEPTAAGVPA